MRVVVDGVVYGFNRFGGINVYFNAVLPRLAQQHGVQVELLVPSKCVGTLPNGGGVKYRRGEFQRPKTGLSWKIDNVWIPKLVGALNATVREAQVRRGRRCVFQSTYFTWTNGRTPQVATAYDVNHEVLPELYDTEFGRWLRRQYREYIQRATRVLAISEKTKQDLVKYYGIDAGLVDVVHLAADFDVFRPMADGEAGRNGAAAHNAAASHHGSASHNGAASCNGLATERPYLLFVGARVHFKNFDLVLQALARTRDVDLVVAGNPLGEGERSRLRELGVETRVREVVHPDAAALRTLYNDCLAFVFPSLHEGFGIPLLEAMGCDAPVLASDTEIFREVAGPAALYFDPYDPESLKSAVESVQENDIREKCVTLGREQAAKYSWDRCARETLAVYERALEA